MKLPFSGLRAGILTQLVFLVVAAMLMVNVAMLNFSERDLVQAKVNMGKLLIHALGENAGHRSGNAGGRLKRLGEEPGFREKVEELLSKGGYSSVVMVDNNGERAFVAGASGEGAQHGLTLAREAMATGTLSVTFSGITWGTLWPGKSCISISAPLLYENRVLGGIAIGSSLDSIYQLLRKSEKIIFLYIILDTIILVLVGIYLLSQDCRQNRYTGFLK